LVTLAISSIAARDSAWARSTSPRRIALAAADRTVAARATEVP
jgi:hypothetical protein